MRLMKRTHLRPGLLAAALLSTPLGGCISVKAPEKPIEINLNVDIRQEVLVRMQRDVEPFGRHLGAEDGELAIGEAALADVLQGHHALVHLASHASFARASSADAIDANIKSSYVNEALAGVINPARFFDVGVPEGYREAVAAYPARA